MAVSADGLCHADHNWVDDSWKSNSEAYN